MIARPRPGRAVQLWYRAGLRPAAPHHGATGTVVCVALGPGPRNHGVRVGADLVVVPCGHLRPVERAAGRP